MRQLLPLVILVFLLSVACQSAAPRDSALEQELPATAAPAAATQPPASATPLPPTATDSPPTPIATVSTPTNTPLPTEGPETSTPTTVPPLEPEAVWGRWANLLFTLSLMPDGSYEVAWPSEQGAESYEMGTYSLDQGILRFIPQTYEEAADNPTLDGCRDKQPYSYKATLLDDPRFMRLNQISDPCGFRVRHWDSTGTTTDEVWQRLEKFSAE